LKKTIKAYAKAYASAYAPLFSIGAIIVFLDQITKEWVRNNLDYMEIFRPELWITEYARIIHWKNTGAAFGMFENMGQVFLVLSMFVTIAILYYYPRIPKEDWLLRLAMGFLFGGALGNMIDRIFHDYAVTDFVSILGLPVFNVADACITIGIAILFLSMLWQEYQEKKAPGSSTVTDASHIPEQEQEAKIDQNSTPESRLNSEEAELGRS
jgi:signal peptidase II